MRRRTQTHARALLGASALFVACGGGKDAPAPAPAASADARASAEPEDEPALEPRRVRLAPLADHLRRQSGEPPPPPIDADEVEGGWIYFVAEGDGRPTIHRIRASGGEREALSRGESAEYPVALLSSGHLVAVRVREPTPDLHLESVILLDALKKRRTRTLGAESRRARNPSAAPDSSWVVFELGDGGEAFSDLFRVDLSDGVLDRLTDNPEGNFEPAVSPDGQQIAFVSSRDGNAELYVMAADGEAPRRLTDHPANESAPRWSPDGRHLAFISDRDGTDRIHLIDPASASPTPRRLTHDRDLVGESEHAWSPDGRRLVFVGVGDRTTSLWIADAERGDTRRLSDDGALDQGPSWSPSGAHIVFASDRGGALDLFRLAVDPEDARAAALVRLTNTPGPDWLPRWFPETGKSAP